MAKVIGIDLGTTNSVVAVMEGGEPSSSPTRRAAALTPSVVAFTEEGETPRRRGRQAAGDHQPREHDLLDQAVHGPPARRGPGARRRWSPTRSSAAPNGDVRVEVGGKEYTPPEISAMILRKLKEARRGLPGRQGQQGGHHRAGLLQRQPAPGHQGRRPDRRARGAADHQRADRRRPGLRARQEEERDRSPSSTSAAAPSTSRSSRSARASSRSTPPTATRTSAATTSTSAHRLHRRRVQEGAGHRPAQGPDGPAAAQGGGREGQERAQLDAADRDQPAVHHRRPSGPKHLTMTLTRGQVRAAGRAT